MNERGWLVALALAAAGCGNWRLAHPADLAAPPDEVSHLLVVVDQRAVDLGHYQVDDGVLRGVTARAWNHCGPVDHPLEEDASPADVAQAHHCIAAPDAEGTRFARNLSDVHVVRAHEPHRGQTACLAVSLSLLGAGAVATPLWLLISFLAAGGTGHGRPFRVRGRPRLPPVRRGARRGRRDSPLRVRRALAAAWTRDAQLEHASVAAFAKLALDLCALGAPLELVGRAHEAALQEVRHAELCFALASAYAGVELAPGALPAHDPETPDLRRLARETLLDGCIGEGLATASARLGAERCRDPDVARVLGILAADEAEHAALAWDILAWALDRDASLGPELSRALPAARAPRALHLPDHGRIGRAELAPIFRALCGEARDRLSLDARVRAPLPERASAEPNAPAPNIE